MSKPKTPATSPNYRASIRPTIVIEKFQAKSIQEAILGVFKRNDFGSIDLDALIHFTLRQFDVNITSYATMQKAVRKHIFAHYAIEQGDVIPHVERNVRRLTICYTIEQDQE